MLNVFSNASNINERRIELFSNVTKQTILTLIEQCEDGVLVNIKNQDELNKLVDKMDNVLVSKLRDKCKL